MSLPLAIFVYGREPGDCTGSEEMEKFRALRFQEPDNLHIAMGKPHALARGVGTWRSNLHPVRQEYENTTGHASLAVLLRMQPCQDGSSVAYLA